MIVNVSKPISYETEDNVEQEVKAGRYNVIEGQNKGSGEVSSYMLLRDDDENDDGSERGFTFALREPDFEKFCGLTDVETE